MSVRARPILQSSVVVPSSWLERGQTGRRAGEGAADQRVVSAELAGRADADEGSSRTRPSSEEKKELAQLRRDKRRLEIGDPRAGGGVLRPAAQLGQVRHGPLTLYDGSLGRLTVLSSHEPDDLEAAALLINRVPPSPSPAKIT